MGKKGTDGRRTSGITPAQVMNELSEHGFALVTAANQPAPSTAFRKNVSATRNKLRPFIAKELRQQGHEVVTSRSGDSVTMHRAGDGASVLLPVEGHMTDNALAAIQRNTGVVLANLQQLQHKKF